MIKETEARAGVSGARRFVVRGGQGFDLSNALLLRPRYNEYPERVALDVGFPRPGRRGPSGVARSSGSTDTDGAGGAGDGGLILRPSIIGPYPPERPAGDRGGVPGGTVGGSTERTDVAGAFDPCVGEGDSWEFQSTILQNGEGSAVSRKISRPFVITHVHLWGSNGGIGLSEDPRVKIMVARSDVAETTYAAATGQWIFGLKDKIHDGSEGIVLHFGTVNRYPGFVWRETPAYLKIAWINVATGTVQIDVSISFRYLA